MTTPVTNPLPFDIPTLIEHLNSKDHLALIIRAHLYVEAILIRHIETALANKGRFDAATLTFPKKVSLAVAMGKVDPAADLSALNALNRLRNKFAHNLDTQLQEQDEHDLYIALSKRQRVVVDDLRKDELDYTGRLRCDLVGLIVCCA